MKKIMLKTSQAPNILNCDTIKLTPEAVLTIQRLQLRSGLTAKQIASDIIVQAECLVTVVDSSAVATDDEEGGTDDG